MRQTRVILLALFSIISYPIYAQRVIKTDTSKVSILRIDPANSNGGNVSDVFEKVDYIPLETTAESTFGNVDQLEIADSSYVILDYNTNAILVFNTDGKFKAKIKEPRDNPRTKIWKFLYNNWTKQIIYFKDDFRTTVFCDLHGKVVKREYNTKPVSPANILIRGQYIGVDKIVNFVPYHLENESTKDVKHQSLLEFIDGKKSIYATAFSYPQSAGKIEIFMNGIGPLTRSGKDTLVYFSKPFENEIYSVSPTSISLMYKIIFPVLNSLPTDFIANSIYYGKRYNYIQNNKSAIFFISNCYVVKQALIFKTNSYTRNLDDNLIYNSKSGNVITYRRLSPDKSTSFLPIFDNTSSNFDNIGLAACDGANLYTSISSLGLFTAKTENSKNVLSYNPVLTKYFRNSTKTSNPVLLRLRLKDNF